MSVLPAVFMFSGQGSQYYHMGSRLFANDITFRSRLLELDETVRTITGVSVLASVYDERVSKADVFERLALTHPAIFMIEVALAQTLVDRNLRPAVVVGVSMGAFGAAVIAGCLSPDSALAAV